MVRTMRVFAMPGRPMRSAWPFCQNAHENLIEESSWPTMTLPTSRRIWSARSRIFSTRASSSELAGDFVAPPGGAASA